MTRILSEGYRFTAVGTIQVILDSAAYIALTGLGVATPPANVSARACGALLGFWLNGQLTFSRHLQPRFRLRLARYLTLWAVMTTISTAALLAIHRHAGLTRAWWSKPMIESALGLTSFLISRHWVYRR